jgi:hypothetical protein
MDGIALHFPRLIERSNMASKSSGLDLHRDLTKSSTTRTRYKSRSPAAGDRSAEKAFNSITLATARLQ